MIWAMIMITIDLFTMFRLFLIVADLRLIFMKRLLTEQLSLSKLLNTKTT